MSGSIIASLIQSILGSPATGLPKGYSTQISANLNADALFNSATAPDASNPNGNLPKAYLSIVFFNSLSRQRSAFGKRFEFVGEGSTALWVVQPGDNVAPLVLNNLRAPKNGYAYIYLNNENDDAVYFDNFTISDTRGKIIEENHYYAYGLKIAGISSVKFGDVNEGSLKNNYQYNDKELWDDADLNWYDYGFRNYDPHYLSR